MPGTLRVRVFGARNLPVMDKSADTTDAFVEIHFGNTSYKTDVCPKSLSPEWNPEWFVFEAEDNELQDECVQFRIMDYDTYSANDPIGRVYLDVNTLVEAAHRSKPTESFGSISHLPGDDNLSVLQKWTECSEMSGWLPILDTINGHRGELKVAVRLELFADSHKLRESSCGVHMSVCPLVPAGYRLVAVHGFVDELLTCGDPEYQWLDKIRTPRATNEARQLLFRRLSNELKRKIGRKVMSLGGNAVIGYQLSFDLEDEATGLVVVRGSGTAATITDEEPRRASPVIPVGRSRSRSTSSHDDSCPPQSVGPLDSSYPSAGRSHKQKLRKQSVVPEDAEVVFANPPRHDGTMVLERNRDLPFLTIEQLPAGVVLGSGGVVCARSVKLLSDVPEKENVDASDIRINWWAELRSEINSHMKALGCNCVVAYREEIAMNEGVCILNCTGTAVLTNNSIWSSVISDNINSTSFDSDDETATSCPVCSLCHIPYSEAAIPFPITLSPCAMCNNSRVPDLILSTAHVPNWPGLVLGTPSLIQTAVVRKLLNDEGSEEQATEISDLLPFVEHQLHNGLLGELRSLGGEKNAIFGLHTTVSIAENALVCITTGSAVSLRPLIIHEDANSAVEGLLQLRQLSRMSEGREALDLTQDRNVICVPLEPDMKNVGADIMSSQNTDRELSPTSLRSWSSRGSINNIKDVVRKTLSRTDLNKIGSQPELNIGIRLWRGALLPDDDSTSIIDKSEKVKNPLGRWVKRFRRRQHEKDTFESSVFSRSLMMQIGVIEESIQDTTNDYISGVCGVVLMGRSTRLADPVNEVMVSTVNAIPRDPMTHSKLVGFYDSTFIRETGSLKELGGLDAFIRLAAAEILRAVQCQVKAFGGNALLSFRFTVTQLDGSLTKNQAQIVFGIAGDIVQIDYSAKIQNNTEE